MKSKSIFFILFACIALLSIGIIQYYLVQYAYTNNEEKVYKNVKNIIKAYPGLEISEQEEESIEHLQQYFAKTYIYFDTINIDSIQAILKKSATSSKEYKAYVSRQYPKGYIRYNETISSLILEQNGVIDTIISKPKLANRIYGDTLDLSTKMETNNAQWISAKNIAYTVLNKRYELDQKLYISTITYIQLPSIRNIVWINISKILLAALFSVAVVIFFFLYALRNIKKQQKLNQIQKDFIDNISHELKTPLASIQMATSVMDIENKERSSGSSKSLETIKRQNKRMQQVINQLYTSSHSFSEVPLVLKEYDHTNYLEKFLRDYPLNTNTISIQYKKEKGVTIRIDAFYLDTALNNIINNAIKYQSTEIIISTAIKNNTLQIFISDNGIGIAKKYREKVFDKYFRISQNNKHNYKGLGLGLFYVKQIIKAHHGNITIQENQNKGTILCIQLPIQ